MDTSESNVTLTSKLVQLKPKTNVNAVFFIVSPNEAKSLHTVIVGSASLDSNDRLGCVFQNTVAQRGQ